MRVMQPPDSTKHARPYARLSGRELVLIFAFWAFLALLSVATRALDPRGFGFQGMSPSGPFALPFLQSMIWALLTPLLFLFSSRLTRVQGWWLLRVLLVVAVGFVVAIGVYLLLAVVREEMFEMMRHRRFRPMREVARFRFLPQLLFYTAIVATGFAREFFLRDRVRQEQATRLQTQLAEARLDALRMQINPHFLFNTLHAISAMVERDPAGVRKMIARLSELLRHTTDSRADEVPLREELGFLQRYVEIMEVRFQGRLRVERRIDEGVLDALVPDLVLQPIVENALEHGASRSSGEGVVEIAAEREGDRLILTVRDNGPGVNEAAAGGVGLANTRERLAALYGDAAALELTTSEQGGAVATLSLPFRTRPHIGEVS